MNVSIEVKEKDNVSYVTLAGEIDAYTAPKVRDELMEAAKGDDVKLIIDLSGVNYMDSTGLGVFVGLFKQLRSNNGDMKLTGMTERLQRLFDITGLADVMDINTEVEGGV
ncbi:STAS domain-containing protein [Siminovitchia acidinfaciens]|uniref:Anti-sigma factor antagonist n=1 Tax=Siminovitchia acidinfaciens TaxID=2321395 RepID=A0A429XZ46_9BACI|nr:anti-sigma factor antagonist [Siminovitchia acidinfaciens]RST74037.1 STAS domain-containing protein [Siminovitchia acidinfaciens]